VGREGHTELIEGKDLLYAREAEGNKGFGNRLYKGSGLFKPTLGGGRGNLRGKKVFFMGFKRERKSKDKKQTKGRGGSISNMN